MNAETESRVMRWVIADWQDAHKIDNAGEWRNVRQALYGASQASFMLGDHDSAGAYLTLSSIAATHTIDCIRLGKS